MTTPKPMLDFDAIRDALSRVVEHYEKTAPVVSGWADDVYIRLNGQADKVVVSELMFAQRLIGQDGEDWMRSDYAANQLYHLLHRLGRDTTGMAGF